MWFIRLVKIKSAPTKNSMEWSDKVRAEAESWGVKFHDTFFTLGKYDIVNIFEAPDEKTAMRVSMLFAPESEANTLVALSRKEVNSWMK